MIVLREPVGLIADELEKPQAEGVAAEFVGFGLAGEEDFFLLFSQRDREWRLDFQGGEGFHDRV